jgi:uncharacterized phage protein gp47/JayE
MNIKPSSSRDRYNLFVETLLNETDKVSKISRHSVLSGVAEGIGKIAGKAEKDIILAMSELFPELSFGTQLDRAAKNLGITQRLGATNSSTYIRIKADPGTTYEAGIHQFISTEGPIFDLEENITIPQEGFAYAKIQSVDTGVKTKVNPLSISKINTQPSGHIAVINEIAAIGGADIETDEMFRIRIQNSSNLYARNTLGMIEQLCIAINPKVLKVFNYGLDNNGKRVLAVLTQNGSNLSDIELAQLLNEVGSYTALSDAVLWGNAYIGIRFKNVEFQPIDISFRVVLDNSIDPDDVRREAQIAISKYMDLRTFDPIKDRVEWDNLLQLIKSTKGVKYVPDQFFYPRADIGVHTYKLPRLRGFLMLNIDGSVISNSSGTLSPIYYPAIADFGYISTILQQL